MSRLKSSAGAKAPAARSAAPAGRGVFVQAPKSDIYVILLGISLAAILTGCLLLGLVMNRYDFKTKPTALRTVSGANLPLVASIFGNLEKMSTVRL